jgi:septation ring formation regulator EzrA
MAENFIHRLKREKAEALALIAELHEQAAEIERYLSTSKFAGFENDYVVVSNDMLPKIQRLRMAAQLESEV